MKDAFELDASRVVDPCAGAGVWCQAARTTWPDSFVHAIEPREEETRHLERNADAFSIADFLKAEVSAGAYDIALTNPPFSLFEEIAEESLRVADFACLYAPIDLLLRAEGRVGWLREHEKHVRALFITPGPIGFRGPGTSTDFRTYGLWVLHQEARAPMWSTLVLPLLPSSSRQWVTRPGTFEVTP